MKRFQDSVERVRVWMDRHLHAARIHLRGAQMQLREAVRRRSTGLLAALAIAGAVLGAAGMAAGAIAIFIGLPAVPNADALWAHNRAESGVTFLAPDGEVIGVRGASYGRRVRLQDLPRHVPQAFLAIEDQRFYDHGGVDEWALLRAAAVNIAAGETVQGGSTITQQLVKNLFLTPKRTLTRKLQEIALAARVERRLTKDEILELYLNRVYLGEQAYGVDAAARRYFGRPATALTPAQAAMLAALPKAPSSYAPTANFARAKQRQRVVLQTMVEAGFLSQAQAREAAREPIRITPRIGEPDGWGYVFDAAMEEVRALGVELPPDAIVQVTVRPQWQHAAAISVRDRLAALRRSSLQGALVSLDEAGAVRAMIGGRDYGRSKFNRATQARRQPGSVFKIFVYTAAMEAGLTPDSVRFDEPVEIRGWRPNNYGETFRGPVTLRTALALSLNTVAALVAEEIGQERVVEAAERMGLSAAMKPYPSIALGTTEATPLEMTEAFAILMRDGRKVGAHIVQQITDSRGVVLYTFQPEPGVQVVQSDIVRKMNNMLGRVVQSGTGTKAQIGRDVAGKTGTSEDYRDAWFIGYTSELTTGVWLGRDDDKSTGRITGGSTPAEIWAQFMTAALAGSAPEPLPGLGDAQEPMAEQALARYFSALRRPYQPLEPDAPAQEAFAPELPG